MEKFKKIRNVLISITCVIVVIVLVVGLLICASRDSWSPYLTYAIAALCVGILAFGLIALIYFVMSHRFIRSELSELKTMLDITSHATHAPAPSMPNQTIPATSELIAKNVMSEGRNLSLVACFEDVGTYPAQSGNIHAGGFAKIQDNGSTLDVVICGQAVTYVDEHTADIKELTHFVSEGYYSVVRISSADPLTLAVGFYA